MTAGVWNRWIGRPSGWAPPPLAAGALKEGRLLPAATVRQRRRGWRRIPHSLYALPAATAAVWLCAALTPQPAAACAVCFGTADPASMEGLQAGILLLLAMVALVFAGVGGFLLAARRRIQRLHGRPTEAP